MTRKTNTHRRDAESAEKSIDEKELRELGVFASAVAFLGSGWCGLA